MIARRGNRLGTALSLLVLLIVPAAAGTCGIAAERAGADSAAEEFRTLMAEYREAVAREGAARQQADAPPADDEEASPERWVTRFQQLIEEHPDDPAAIDALMWLLVSSPDGAATADAADLILEHQPDRARLAGLCRLLGVIDTDDAAALRILTAIGRKLPADDSCADVRVYTQFALARVMKEQPELTVNPHQDPQPLSAPTCRIVEQLLEAVVRDHRDLEFAGPSFRRDLKRIGIAPEAVDAARLPATLREAAAAQLDDLRHLSVGRTAPDLDGTDLDGRPLRLRDYRGKVVVLTFWSKDCGICRGELAHLRELAQRLEGRPFAILGVNGDADRAAAKDVAAAERVSWPSFWSADGDDGFGPIARRWQIRQWPALYLLDAQGVIRSRGNALVGRIPTTDADGRPQEIDFLDAAVDRLLRETPAPARP